MAFERSRITVNALGQWVSGRPTWCAAIYPMRCVRGAPLDEALLACVQLCALLAARFTFVKRGHASFDTRFDSVVHGHRVRPSRGRHSMHARGGGWVG